MPLGSFFIASTLILRTYQEFDQSVSNATWNVKIIVKIITDYKQNFEFTYVYIGFLCEGSNKSAFTAILTLAILNEDNANQVTLFTALLCLTLIRERKSFPSNYTYINACMTHTCTHGAHLILLLYYSTTLIIFLSFSSFFLHHLFWPFFAF